MKWHVKPKSKVYEISAQHDICYDMGTADSSPIVSLSVSVLSGAIGVMGRRIASSLFPSHHPLLPPHMSRKDY